MGDVSLSLFLENWARWELAQREGEPSSKTMLAKLMEGRGEILPAGTAPINGPGDSIEEHISLSVGRLALVNRMHADILRIEYGAIKVNGLHPTDTQQTRAIKLGVPSLRTYSRALKTAREWVLIDLNTKLKRM